MIKRAVYLIILYIIINAISPNLAHAMLMLVISIIYSLIRLLASSAFGTALAVKQSVMRTYLGMNTTQIFVNGLVLVLGFAILLAVMEMIKALRKH